MHRLDAHLALPHALEPALLLLGSGALPSRAVAAEALAAGAVVCPEGGALAEQRPRGAEDAAGGGGHGVEALFEE